MNLNVLTLLFDNWIISRIAKINLSFIAKLQPTAVCYSRRLQVLYKSNNEQRKLPEHAQLISEMQLLKISTII